MQAGAYEINLKIFGLAAMSTKLRDMPKPTKMARDREN